MPVVEASLTLSFLYQYVGGSNSETIDSTSPDIRLMFWICFIVENVAHSHTFMCC